MRQDPKLTRGYRNRNPGNIDHVPSNKWLGLADPPLEPPPRAGGRARFCVFKTHQHGVRALAVLLATYQDRHGLRTVRGIIERWAPSSENNTRAYQNAVARKLDVDVGETIDLHDPDVMRKLVTAIIEHELGGNPYAPEVIAEGLRMAGLVQPGVARTRTARAAAGTAVAGAGTAAVVETASAFAPHLGSIAELVRALGPWIVAATVVCAAGYFIWTRWRAQQEIAT